MANVPKGTDFTKAVDETKDHMLETPAADLVLSLKTELLTIINGNV